eukprot:Sspe_Gene.77236::Locus_48249_Transcript_1_1_Confidence_1.000_Length_906::g.77236::m.77236
MWAVDHVNKGSFLTLPLDHGVPGHVVTTGETVNVKDPTTLPFFADYMADSIGELHGLLCVPMHTQDDCSGDILGCLLLANKYDESGFDQADEDLAKAFANYAGISIANTQETDMFRPDRDDSQLPEVPLIKFGRIAMKGGWHTVRKALRDGALRLPGRPRKPPAFKRVSFADSLGFKQATTETIEGTSPRGRKEAPEWVVSYRRISESRRKTATRGLASMKSFAFLGKRIKRRSTSALSDQSEEPWSTLEW